MPRFLLLARDDPDGFTDYSPAEMQALIERYVEWGRGLAESGHLESSSKLREGVGRVLGPGGSVTDGPFTEAKEVVGGFWVLRADDLAQAERLASECPHLEFGTLEIRELEPTGPE